MIEDEDEISSAGRADWVPFASQIIGDGALILGNDGENSYDYPKPYKADEWAEAMARLEAYWARQRVVWGRIRRIVFLAGCAFAGLLLVLATHHG